MSEIDPLTLRRARDEFRALLERPTKEAAWQRFFAEHPYALIPSLPLRLEPRDIVPLGRPGHTEPDFIFYPHDRSPIPYYGVIELKRPDQRIAVITRANVAVLTRDAQTAVVQAQQYIAAVPQLIKLPLAGGHLFLGNDRHLFVIMGLSEDLIFQPGNALYSELVQGGLPRNLQILPYDYLRDNFEKSIYRHLHILVPVATSFGPVRLRTEPRLDLSSSEVQTMLREKGFYDSDWNYVGKGLKHQYEARTRNRAQLVHDRTTGLTWQQGGSDSSAPFAAAQKHIEQLNREKFAGYSDWRLPTLEEGMSLMEPEKKNGDLYIDPVFDKNQSWIWTADQAASGGAWCVGFFGGTCYRGDVHLNLIVRAVRSGQS